MDPRYKSPTANVDRPEEGEFRDLEYFTNALKWLLRAGVALAAFSLISAWMQIDLLSRPYTPEEGETNDLREAALAILTMLFFFVTVISFGRWIVLAHRNLPALGARHVDFTPGWALGWFFIPVATWWKPYQAMRSLWKHSHDVHRPEIEDTTWVLPVWWTFWIISSLLGNIAMRVAFSANTIDELIVSTRLNLANCAIDIPLYAVASVLVTRIWQAQRAQKDRPADVVPTGFADAPSIT